MKFLFDFGLLGESRANIKGLENIDFRNQNSIFPRSSYANSKGRNFRFHMLSKNKPGGGLGGFGHHSGCADSFPGGRDGRRPSDMVRSPVL
jgi:hypothetical protein